MEESATRTARFMRRCYRVLSRFLEADESVDRYQPFCDRIHSEEKALERDRARQPRSFRRDDARGRDLETIESHPHFRDGPFLLAAAGGLKGNGAARSKLEPIGHGLRQHDERGTG